MTSIQQQKWFIKIHMGNLTANNCYTATQLNAQLKQRAFLVSHQSESAVLSIVCKFENNPTAASHHRAKSEFQNLFPHNNITQSNRVLLCGPTTRSLDEGESMGQEQNLTKTNTSAYSI